MKQSVGQSEILHCWHINTVLIGWPFGVFFPSHLHWMHSLLLPARRTLLWGPCGCVVEGGLPSSGCFLDWKLPIQAFPSSRRKSNWGRFFVCFCTIIHRHCRQPSWKWTKKYICTTFLTACPHNKKNVAFQPDQRHPCLLYKHPKHEAQCRLLVHEQLSLRSRTAQKAKYL